MDIFHPFLYVPVANRMIVQQKITAIPPDAAAAGEEFLDGFDRATRSRGESYYRRGSVRSVEQQADGLDFTGQIQGAKRYTTEVFYEDGEWCSDCSCPVGGDCKHAYALMRAILPGAMPGVAATDGNMEDARTPVTVEQALAGALGRKLGAAERSFARRIDAIYRTLMTQRFLSSWDLREIIPRSGYSGFEERKPWPSTPKDALELWHFLAHELQHRKMRIPEFMRPITDLRTVAGTMREWEREQRIREWKANLENIGFPHGGAPLPTLDLRLAIGAHGARLEWKAFEEPAFKSLKSAQLRHLIEAHRSYALDLLPGAAELWHSMLDPSGLNCDLTLHYHRDSDVARLNRLVRLASLRERIVGSRGQPLLWSADELTWQIQEPQDEQEDYGLRLLMPDGNQAPEILVILPGKPTLYVGYEAVFKGPAGWARGPEFSGQMAIPGPALETKAGIEFVTRLGAMLPPRLRSKVRICGVFPEIKCRLDRSSGERPSDALWITVEAAFQADRHREQFMVEGWTATRSPKAGEDKNCILVDDKSLLDTIPLFLHRLGPSWDVCRRKWKLRVTRDFPERFASWVASLPKAVKIDLDERLATLMHPAISATVRVEARPVDMDWFDLKLVADIADTQLTPEEVALLLKEGKRFVWLGAKGWRRLDLQLDEFAAGRLNRLGLGLEDVNAPVQRFHVLQLADESLAPMLEERQMEDIRRRAFEIKTKVEPHVPEEVRAELRPYQVAGFHFLAYLGANRFGGILADDMGLGKTLQALCWLAWTKGEKPSSKPDPNLVICPKSVMNNWQSEAARFTPGLRVKLCNGADGTRLDQALEGVDLLVLNYTQLRLLWEALAKVSWRTVILDEGQFIKNPSSQTARAACVLPARHRLVLTGTPIENRLMDLWSLMNFAMPGLLGNRARFQRRFGGNGGPASMQQLAVRVRPFLLRRTKTEVAPELPERVEEELLTEMEGTQKTLYQAELKRAQRKLLNITTDAQLDRTRFHFLASLMKLRQICCHPALLGAGHAGASSVKSEALLDLLEPLLQEGHKVLVFSQFVEMLKLIRAEVKSRQWSHFYLVGDTEDRGRIVKDFQDAQGAAVFLLSLRAGGFGLNLSAASYVVLYDPWWNPAVEHQAIDRTHRIGQTSKVIAYRLLAKDTIEEKVRVLQRQKSALIQGVLGDEVFAGKLTLQDFQFLLSDPHQ